ncbi:hypothetical protein K469DRAFT_731103 [Zopfia rhizophila CBS 207.26]|uniref:SET domain-containing protein n=1 Tax=Zopfia rhizophila CBS 207.26 TaxID=1314779 RepID=A0A6A6EKD1_9PEZI|nr:hypothetical protein K469DRAFT_731103 [Zopfia rhizophila CBS 207.26]
MDVARRNLCLPNRPYSITLRLKLAAAYRSLGYPDLAAGEAYKALLLIDEVMEEGEYHDAAMEAAKTDITSGEAIAALDRTVGVDQEAIVWARICWSQRSYSFLVGCLIDCGCLRSAFDYNSRALRLFPSSMFFQLSQKTLVAKVRSYFESKGEIFEHVDVLDYPDNGLVRQELYPWNNHEPDRFSSEGLLFLNTEMTRIAPKLEVQVTNLPILSLKQNTNGGPPPPDQELRHIQQLGVFAKEDISPGELILQEKSILTSVSRLHESFCDACSASLPITRGNGVEFHEGAVTISCENCDDVFFCSAECWDLAQVKYHPALCGASIDPGKVPASEAADSLYSLLLIRTLAMAETQDIHPLDLVEVKYIWGDYHGLDLDQTWEVDLQGRLLDSFGSVPPTLPFSFNGNILMPLHMLEKMGVNIFEQSHRYDLWVFNTLYAKFRGTASARQGLDGRPEIGAVHPMWCLANHSCDPNVTWEWQGSMRFWTRQELVQWKGRDPEHKPGIRKGEEVLSHYCDVTLPVRERREWAIGALGGDCVCPRCMWEEAERRGETA